MSVGPEHEVVDEELRAPSEEVCQRDAYPHRSRIGTPCRPGPTAAPDVAAPARRCAASAPFSASSSSFRAAIHSSCDTTLCSRRRFLGSDIVAFVLMFSFLWLILRLRDQPFVLGDAVYAVCAGEGAILAHDLGRTCRRLGSVFACLAGHRLQVYSSGRAAGE